MLPPTAFKEELDTVLHGHQTLSHPMFRELFDPAQARPDLLRKVALQGYQLTKNFLGYIEHLHFHCPLPKFKRALLINMYEEETGHLSRTANHLELMQNFIAALGVSETHRDAAQPLLATRALIDYRWQAVRDPARYHVAAAAVMIASEGQNLETRGGETRHALLARCYGLRPADLQFFSVHQQEDAAHVEEGLDLVSALCTTSAMQKEALDAVDHTCRLFYAMYQSMYIAYCRPATMA